MSVEKAVTETDCSSQKTAPVQNALKGLDPHDPDVLTTTMIDESFFIMSRPLPIVTSFEARIHDEICDHLRHQCRVCGTPGLVLRAKVAGRQVVNNVNAAVVGELRQASQQSSDLVAERGADQQPGGESTRLQQLVEPSQALGAAQELPAWSTEVPPPGEYALASLFLDQEPLMCLQTPAVRMASCEAP